MPQPYSRIPELKGEGMRLRMYAKVDQLSTAKELKSGLRQFGNVLGMLNPIFQRVRDDEPKKD